MGFPQQECWSGLQFPSPGDLPRPGIKPVSPILAGIFFTIKPPGKPRNSLRLFKKQCWNKSSLRALDVPIPKWKKKKNKTKNKQTEEQRGH